MSAYEYLIAAFATLSICLTGFALSASFKRRGSFQAAFRFEILGAVSMFTALFFFLSSVVTWLAGV